MRSLNLEFRLQLRSTIDRTLNEIMYANQISATDMEEAVEHFLLSLRERVLLEYAEAKLQEEQQLQEQLAQMTENNPQAEEENTEEE